MGSTDMRITVFHLLEALFVLLLAAVASAVHGAAIERSPADPRDYRAVMLDNGLEALVVSDPGADKAAAVLNVNVGTANDPESRPGLAHFLEHMLFLGTEKYPEPDEYNRFISEHGGSSNAGTSFAHTSYFFDVDAAHLEGALDRFAQFFISPRFDREYVERERQVVHSEYVSRRRSDRRRGLAAWKQTLDPRHPLSRFHIGNAEVLADHPETEIRDELIDFYRSAYSSHLMKLVVLGREPLDALERLVRSRFAPVKRRDAERLRITVPLYREGVLPARLDVEPIRELRTISLTFAIPALRPHYRTRPLTLVSHLLGHEGRGSLLSALKARGWAEGLSAGPGIGHPDFATYGVTIQATAAGLVHVDDVISSAFAYLDLIRADGIEPHYHDELARMAEIGFRYLEKADALSHAVSLAAALHVYPVHEVLTAPYRFGAFDPALERRFLSALVPERALVTVIAKGVETDAVAPYHEAPYRLSPIPPRTLAQWRNPTPDDALALPGPNPFVPDDLALIEVRSPEPHPDRIVRRPGFELWHHADLQFGQPRTNFYFAFRSPITNDSPRHAVLSALLARTTNDALAEFAYPAALAGQSYSLYRHRRGITVRLSGWSDKLHLLLERIVPTLRAPPLPPQRFEAEKEEFARTLRNIRERTPYHRAMGDLRELLVDPEWSAPDLLAALDEVTVDDLREYVAGFFAQGQIVALAHGNIAAEPAVAMGKVLEDELLGAMQAVPVTRGRVARLAPGVRYSRWLESGNEDHALAVYRQAHGRGFADRAMMALIAQAIGTRFFHELRTERKIGYIVFFTPLPVLDVPGLALVVQSPTTSPEQLHQHVDSFIDRSGETLRGMSSAVFERHRAAVESSLLEAETRLDERTARYWTEIDREHYEFDWRERYLESVRAIAQDDLVAAWEDLVAVPESARGVVAVVSNRQDTSPGQGFGGAEPVPDADDFKRRQRYFDES